MYEIVQLQNSGCFFKGLIAVDKRGFTRVTLNLSLRCHIHNIYHVIADVIMILNV